MPVGIYPICRSILYFPDLFIILFIFYVYLKSIFSLCAFSIIASPTDLDDRSHVNTTFNLWRKCNAKYRNKKTKNRKLTLIKIKYYVLIAAVLWIIRRDRSVETIKKKRVKNDIAPQEPDEKTAD